MTLDTKQTETTPLAVQGPLGALYIRVLAGLARLNGPDDHANDPFCFNLGIQPTCAGYSQRKYG